MTKGREMYLETLVQLVQAYEAVTIVEISALTATDRCCHAAETGARSGGSSRRRAYGRDLGFRWAGSSRISIILRAQ